MAFVLWMTGLPCSGKTTLSRMLSDKINNLAILDGDELREWLSPKDFSQQGRNVHNRKVALLAKLLFTFIFNNLLFFTIKLVCEFFNFFCKFEK